MTSNQHATWALITNSNDCRIYQYIKKPHQLTLIKEIKHLSKGLKKSNKSALMLIYFFVEVSQTAL